MFTRPEIKDYRSRWLEAERQIAINSIPVLGWPSSTPKKPNATPATPASTPKVAK